MTVVLVLIASWSLLLLSWIYERKYTAIQRFLFGWTRGFYADFDRHLRKERLFTRLFLGLVGCVSAGVLLEKAFK